LDIPLVPQVVEWLQALKVMAADSEFVFPFGVGIDGTAWRTSGSTH
jgi:hypothetical protein